jgi:hypothetical protein
VFSTSLSFRTIRDGDEFAPEVRVMANSKRRPFDFKDAVIDEARLRQNGKCACCGTSLDDVWENAHHVIPNQSGEPGNPKHAWLMQVDNCVVLCENCHYRVHQDGRYQNGTIAGPDYYPHSHGTNSPAHKAWVKAVDGKAKQLFLDVQRKKLERDLTELLSNIEHGITMNSNEHRFQLDLIARSLAGYWTNRWFNSRPPDLVIWNNAFVRVVAAKAALRRGDLKGAFHGVVRAQASYFAAFRFYTRWKTGIESAGTKAQIAVGAAAFAAVLSTVAAYGVAAGAAATEAAALSGQVATNLARAEAAVLTTEMTVIEGEAAMIRIEEQIIERELLNAAEAELEEFLAAAGGG